MADKETGLQIPVSAYADKDSVKEAINELTKGVLSSLKDGYIEVPAEIKASYARGSKELDKAQKDVIKLYEKMSKEGFSSSADDLDNLIEKYKKFKSLAGKEGKGNSKQTKWLTKTIGGTLQPYLTQKRELELIVKSFEESVAKIEKSTKISIKKSTSKKSKDYTVSSDRKHTTGGKRYEGLRSIGPQDPKTGWVDPSATNEYEAHNSELSPYKSSQAKQMRQSERDFYKDPAHQAKSSKPSEEEFNKIWSEVSSKSKQLSDVEKAKGLSKTLTDKLLPKLINDILSERDTEGSAKQFSDTAEAIYKLSETAGIHQYDVAKNEIDSVMRKFFDVRGRIGGTDGTDKTAGLNNEAIKAIVKDLFTKIEKKMDTITDEIQVLEKTTKSSTKQRTAIKDANTIADKIISKLTASDQTQTQTAQATTKAVDAVTTATETQTNFDKIENSAERVADSKEGKANRQLIDDIQHDANTGMNTDANTQILFGKLDSLYNTILKGFGVKNNFETEEQVQALGSNNENDEPIIKILSSILNEVTAIADKMGVERVQDSLQNNLPIVIPPNVSTALTTTTNNTGLPDLYKYIEDGILKTAGVIDHPDNRPGLRFKEDKTDYEALAESYKYQEHARELEKQAKETEKILSKKTIKERRTVFYIIFRRFSLSI